MHLLILGSKRGAFTLVDLLVIIGIMGILTALLVPTLGRAKQNSIEVTCLNNLRQLGIGMHMYIQHNNDKVPYAAIRMIAPTAAREMTWDSLLNHYVGGKQTEDQLWDFRVNLTNIPALPVLKCPSDRSPRRKDMPPPILLLCRSYAMPRYMDFSGNLDDGKLAPWPPSAQSRAGIGLNFSPLSKFWNNADNRIGDGSPANPRPSHQTAIKSNVLPEPAGTIALTERIHCANIMGLASKHDIGSTEEHMASGERMVYDPTAGSHHGGPFNYLMIDGHVSFLLPAKTTSNLGLQRGMWSIKAGD